MGSIKLSLLVEILKSSRFTWFNRIKLSLQNQYLSFSILVSYNINPNKSMQTRKTLLLLILCILLQFTFTYQHPDRSFQAFKANSNQQYSEEEEPVRMKAYQKHMNYVREREKLGETIPINDLFDKTEEQLAVLTNFVPKQPNNTVKSKPHLRVSTAFSSAPSSYDFRSLGKVTPVKNQGDCGSCWAFSATAHYESLLLIHTSTEYDLAEQYMLQCTNGSTCDGGYPEDAIQRVKNGGMPLESKYPYLGKDNNTAGICSEGSLIKLPAAITVNQYRTNIANVQDLKQMLISLGPMTVGVTAGDQYFYYPQSGGIVNCPVTVGEADHVVLLVGYTSTHWIIKNSWGTSWGQAGYGFLAFDKDCGILKNVWIIETNPPSPNPNPNPNPTPDPDPKPCEEVTLQITMKDSFGDGWNGNVLALKQSGTNNFVGTFGEDFSQGQNKIMSVAIPKAQTEIVVKTYGQYTSEIGFQIKTIDGSILFNRNPGSSYGSEAILGTFYQGMTCGTNTLTNNSIYQIYLSDSYSDGWNDGKMKIVQGDKALIVGEGFTSGQNFGPIPMELQKGVEVGVFIEQVGEYSDEMEILIRDQFGSVAFQYPKEGQSTQNHYKGKSLGSFCPGCVNLLPVNILPRLDTKHQSTISQQSTKETDSSTTETEKSGPISLLIAAVCLSGVLLLLIIGLIVMVLKMGKKLSKEKLEKDSIGTGSNLERNGAMIG